MNWYAYCGNNPIKYVDPTGLVITEAEMKMYESGKMAPMAYSYMMSLTYHQYLADDNESKSVYLRWEDEFRKNEYKTTNGLFKYVDDGIDFMIEKPGWLTPMTEEMHYFRNKLNLNFSWEEYEKLQERLPDNMKWIEGVAVGYHQNNTVNKPNSNRKYVSFDGHFELVFNDNNVLQAEYNNPEDMGTYNYNHPVRDKIGHIEYDVRPYGLIPKANGFLFPSLVGWGNVKK